MVEERWLPVIYKGIPFPGYEVSDLGRVRSHRRWLGSKSENKSQVRILKATIRSGGRHAAHHGYFYVGLRRNGKRYYIDVHRLVLEAFIEPCPDGMQARHGPNGRFDNSVDNLCYGTPVQDSMDKVRDGTAQRGEKNGNAKLTEEDVRYILRQLTDRATTHRALARQLNISHHTIRDIWRRRAWRHITQV